MGVPREPVRLVGDVSDSRMIAERSGKDWTSAIQRFAVAASTRAQGIRTLRVYLQKRFTQLRHGTGSRLQPGRHSKPGGARAFRQRSHE